MITKIVIAAVSQNKVIGNNGKLPWHIPADLAHFKKETTNHAIVMGRITHQSIGKTLPHRLNLVLSANMFFRPSNGSIKFLALGQAIKFAEFVGYQKIFLIGGQRIYQQGIAIADEMHITFVLKDFEGDTTFPNFNINNWIQTNGEIQSTDEDLPFYFSHLVRKKA